MEKRRERKGPKRKRAKIQITERERQKKLSVQP